MQVDLNEDEVAALLTALDQYIPGLREEIGKTENYDYREELKAQEASLHRVVTKLGHKPNSIIGDFIDYLLARHQSRILAIHSMRR